LQITKVIFCQIFYSIYTSRDYLLLQPGATCACHNSLAAGNQCLLHSNKLQTAEPGYFVNAMAPCSARHRQHQQNTLYCYILHFRPQNSYRLCGKKMIYIINKRR